MRAGRRVACLFPSHASDPPGDTASYRAAARSPRNHVCPGHVRGCQIPFSAWVMAGPTGELEAGLASLALHYGLT